MTWFINHHITHASIDESTVHKEEKKKKTVNRNSPQGRLNDRLTRQRFLINYDKVKELNEIMSNKLKEHMRMNFNQMETINKI